MMRKIISMLICVVLFLIFQPAILHAVDDPYNTPGFDPDRETFKTAEFEHIDPFSGGLILNFEDMRLPGNGGLDVVIQRTYNSKNACETWLNTDTTYPADVKCSTTGFGSWVGHGWTLHFGKLITGASSHIIEMPDGSRHEAFPTPTANTYITKDYWILKYSAGNYELMFTDGKKITFTLKTSVYYASQIEEPNGNRIVIEYHPSSAIPDYYGAISAIKEYLPNSYQAFRTTTFELTAYAIEGVRRLSAIVRPDNNKITFLYDTSSNIINGGNHLVFLKEVRLPMGQKWGYTYDDSTMRPPELLSVKTPFENYGQNIQYEYGTSSVQYASVVSQ